MNVIKCDLPEHIKGMTVKTFDEGEDCYTIVLNSRLNDEQQLEAYEHEFEHLKEDDFSRIDWFVSEIEMLRHRS